jgi:hypothetical protein
LSFLFVCLFVCLLPFCLFSSFLFLLTFFLKSENFKKSKQIEKERRRKKTMSTLFILDWDDTLFPTFLVSRRFLNDKNGAEEKKLNILDKKVVNLLTKIMSSNLVSYLFIVTNSKKGWVEKSSYTFLPLTYQFIKNHNKPDNKFCLVSARSLFEPSFPKEPVVWKILTFDKVLDSLAPSAADSIISVGDGNAERTALFEMDNGILKKSIKFIENPTIEDLIHQIDFISSKLDKLLNYTQPIDGTGGLTPPYPSL